MASFVWMVLLIDMKELEVLGTHFLCAALPQEAAQKARAAFEKANLVKENTPYHLHILNMGAIPGTENKVIIPRIDTSKLIPEAR